MRKLRLLLGDQLNDRHSWFARVDPEATYVMMEVLPETRYVTHHIQKIAGFFAAMRRFAAAMSAAGHHFVYLRLDDPENRQSFPANLTRLIESRRIECFEYLLPDEYRLDQILQQFAGEIDIPVAAADTEHFLSTREEVGAFFRGRKTFVMEAFYRHMRRKWDILMDGDQPLSGRWNYDSENRNSLPQGLTPPAPLNFDHDVSEIVALIRSMDIKTIGRIDAAHFPWPLDHQETLQLLDHFLANGLAQFGTYQDAMDTASPYWYHSRLSFAMNLKLLHPREIVQKTLAYWQGHPQAVGIAQVEGFIRQIIGWREFMRGIYWAHMPAYEQLNYFDHQRPLPAFYWSGDTRMNCLRHAITQSLDLAYAHHIQRLMLTGNFANLLGVHPDEVDAWYLGIYIDAIQWVEITNTRGMSQYADGGIAATKPYVSSANYIHKMSNYCRNCHYDRQKRYGEGACPFNSLYWDFFDRHRALLDANPRVGMAYRNLDRMAPEELEQIRRQARYYQEHQDDL